MNTSMQRGIAVPALVGIVALLMLLGGGIYISRLYSKNESGGISKKHETQDGAMMEGKEHELESEEDKMMEKKMMTADATTGDMMMKKDGAMTKNGSSVGQYSGVVFAGSASPLLDFNKADYDRALSSGKPILLYFYASWCPICKNETANSLYPAFGELKDEKVIGFRVNFKDDDTDKDEVALAKEFGVSYQHTKVILKNGNRVLKSPESWDKSRYLKEINAI